MSRSGYSEDLDPQQYAMWRGRIASAIRGKRGQEFLKKMVFSLENMKEKHLITKDLRDEHGDVCALGAVMVNSHFGDLVDYVDPESHDVIGRLLDISPCLVQEIEWENDEVGDHNEATDRRHARMLKWAKSKIRPKSEKGSG